MNHEAYKKTSDRKYANSVLNVCLSYFMKTINWFPLHKFFIHYTVDTH